MKQMKDCGYPMHPALNAARATGLVAFALLVLTHAASGQTAPSPSNAASSASNDPSIQLQAFEVTGSSIKRIDAQTALPVLTVTTTDIDAMGVSTAEQLVKTLSVTSTLGHT